MEKRVHAWKMHGEDTDTRVNYSRRYIKVDSGVRIYATAWRFIASSGMASETDARHEHFQFTNSPQLDVPSFLF